jgi:hypothetical protein
MADEVSRLSLGLSPFPPSSSSDQEVNGWSPVSGDLMMGRGLSSLDSEIRVPLLRSSEMSCSSLDYCMLLFPADCKPLRPVAPPVDRYSWRRM